MGAQRLRARDLPVPHAGRDRSRSGSPGGRAAPGEVAGATVVRTLRRPPARTARNAPAVIGPLDSALRVRVSGLPPRTSMSVWSRIDGRYVRLGTARSTATGTTVLPAFRSDDPGAHLLRLNPKGARPLYLKVVLR